MTLDPGRPRELDRDDRLASNPRRRRSSNAPVSPDVGATKSKRIWKIVGTVVSLAIMCLSVAVLARTVTTMNLGDLRSAVQAIAGGRLFLSACCTAGSYLMLTGYDYLALKQLRLRVPYRTAALASFTSYAISFTLGFPLITAGVVRYWIYAQAGVRGSKIASLTVIAGVTFWLGMALVLGIALSFDPKGLASVDHLGGAVNTGVGAAILTALAAYLVWVARGHRRTRVMGLRLELPGLGLSLGQILLGVLDLSCASGALFLLLPHTGLKFTGFAGIYVLACLLGMASNVPGGVGAFEATILKTVPASPGALLASLLMFRAVYYLGPFVLALALLGAHEAFQRWKTLREAMADEADEENMTP
jgi:glycosyltransferase 2 family protein